MAALVEELGQKARAVTVEEAAGLGTEGNRHGGDRFVLFVAGDDEEAKAVVSGLIEEIGFEPLDTGSLQDGGRKQQPGSPIYNNPMTAEQAHETLAGLR